MPNSKVKCRHCKEYTERENAVRVPLGYFCSIDHATSHGREKSGKEREKIERKELKQRKKEITSRKDWYSKLQSLVNQFVRIRDEGKPCCTCGTTNPSIKYDAGHFIAVKRGGVDPRRFELTNIHKQCSVNCNQHGSGMRAEYKQFIIDTYGKDHLEWLLNDSNHKPLKERFPHWTDIENEIKEYRKKIRELGYKPVV